MSPEDHAQLLDHVRSLTQGIADAEEIAQEVVVRALEAAEDGEQSLFDRVKVLVAQVRCERWAAARRGGWVAEHDAESEATVPDPQRRERRRPVSLPKGTLAFGGNEIGHFVLPMDCADPPTPELICALHRMWADVLEPTAAGWPISPEASSAILDLFQRLYGHGPEAIWADILIEEISVAKAQDLAQKTGGRTDHSQREITMRGESAKEPIGPLRRRLRHRDRILFDVETAIGGKPATLSLFATDGETFRYPSEPDARAHAILQRTIGKLLTIYHAPTLPEYVVDAELVAWLFERFGFEGGGGPNNLIKQETMLVLLQDPDKLAQEVERYGRRKAAQAAESLSADLEQRFEALAERIRRRGAQ